MLVEAFIAITSTFMLTFAIAYSAKRSIMLLSHSGNLLSLGQVLLDGGNS